MKEETKKLCDNIIQRISQDKELRAYMDNVLDDMSKKSFASLFISTITIQDKTIDMQKEINKVYNNIMDSIIQGKYRYDILFLALLSVLGEVYDSNSEIKEASEYLYEQLIENNTE